MAFAIFALPAGAANPQKIYSINVGALGVTPVAVTIKNETPNGNSTINSFIIKPPGGVTATVASPASSAAATVTRDATTGWIYVNAFNGLKAGNQTPKTLTINLNASYGSLGPTCGSGYTWTAVVYTGNAWGQETFDPVIGSPPTNPTQSAPCNYSVTLTPGSVPVGATSAMTATFSNAATSAGSINSVTLTAPSPLAINSATLPVGVSGTVSALPGGSVTISGITPAIAPGQSLAVNLQAAVPCGATSPANWTSSVGGSGTFALTGSNPSTTLTGPCKLQFVAQPANVVSGYPFNVQVQALNGAGSPISSFNGPVTLTLGGTGIFSPGVQSAAGGVVTNTGVTITGIGQFTLTASSSLGGASLNLTTLPFTVFAGGPLNCQPTPPYAFENILPPGVTTILQPGYAEGKRGPYNKDGSQCIPLGYTFTNNILTNNSVLLTWDTSQPGAAFEYTVTWKPEYVVAATGLPARVTRVAWFDSMGVLGPVVPARACLSRNLPSPYGSLTSAIGAGDLAISVSASGTPPTPFPIVIGLERMTVTNVSGSTWTVVRGVGGSTAATHGAGTNNVMSTPLPLDGSGVIMRMCIAEEGWTAVPPGANDCPTSTTASPTVPVPTEPRACVLFSTTIFDLGDGFVNRDF